MMLDLATPEAPDLALLASPEEQERALAAMQVTAQNVRTILNSPNWNLVKWQRQRLVRLLVLLEYPFAPGGSL